MGPRALHSLHVLVLLYTEQRVVDQKFTQRNLKQILLVTLKLDTV